MQKVKKFTKKNIQIKKLSCIKNQKKNYNPSLTVAISRRPNT